MDLNQDFNSAQLHQMMQENHEFCGQGWDKQFNLTPEKHHYKCTCDDCIGPAFPGGDSLEREKIE